jgi:hypothetical protein
MATRSAHTFENRFNEGSSVEPEDLIEDVQTFAPDPLKVQRLWTLIDPMTPSGMEYFVPGYHFVNRVAYFYSARPWSASDMGDEFRRW